LVRPRKHCRRNESWPPKGLGVLGWLLYPYFPRAVVKLRTLSGGKAEYVEQEVRACSRKIRAGNASRTVSVLVLGGRGRERLVVVVPRNLRHYTKTTDVVSSCRVAGVFCGDDMPPLDLHLLVAIGLLPLWLAVIAVFPPAKPVVEEVSTGLFLYLLGRHLSLVRSPPQLEYVELVEVARAADPGRGTTVVCADIADIHDRLARRIYEVHYLLMAFPVPSLRRVLRRYALKYIKYIEKVRKTCEQAIQELGGATSPCPTAEPPPRHRAVDGLFERFLEIMYILLSFATWIGLALRS